MGKNKKIIVNENEIRITSVGEEDYICITDMIKAKDGEFFISDWLRNRNTIEFLATWESLYNKNFNYGEIAIIKDKSGLNSFKMSVKEWVSKTNAVGIIAKTGRYGGTYAHKDIAFEFGTWISPKFKLYLIKEFQRLKEVESNTGNLEWNIKRVLAKANHRIHTDAIKDYVLPEVNVLKDKEWTVYANEVDMVSVALFGSTAKQWKKDNPQQALNGMNMRDVASIEELTVLSNLQSLNAEMIKSGIPQQKRFSGLQKVAKSQLQSLSKVKLGRSIIKQIENTKDHISSPLSTFNKSLKTALNYNPKEDKG